MAAGVTEQVAGWEATQMMDGLTLFGLLAVSEMLVFYALEDRSSCYVLAFAPPVPAIMQRRAAVRIAA